MSKIVVLETFNELKNRGTGVFVIVDKPVTPDGRIHEAACNHVAGHHFDKKVIQNQEQKGSYHWYETVEQAKADFPNAADCAVCR